ncbi:MAG: hypothetical protein QNJ33_03465 [Crocosphaera sp.]|nr:hypothetical protein [Crocosphaera sp.]
MANIFYPNLDLFSYDLRSGLGDTPEEIEDNRGFFVKKFPKPIQSALQTDFDNEIDNNYIYLFKEKYLPLEFSRKDVTGYAYPVQLSDAYGLLVECASEQITEPHFPEYFADLKLEITQILNYQVATIGQTWLVSAYLNPEETDVESIAKSCYHALFPELNWPEELEGQGKFLGGYIFQLSRRRLTRSMLSSKEEIITAKDHVIIILYRDQHSLELSSNFYDHWMQLFHYYHKISFAYAQSQLLAKSIKKDFSEIQSGSEQITTRLHQRKQLNSLRLIIANIQDKLSDYTRKLNAIEIQKGTIEINVENYEERLKKIITKAKEKELNCDLNFLEEFSQLVTKKYLKQIEKNLENLERGFKLLENEIKAVAIQIEVEKSDRERNFQTLLTTIGTGTAGTSLIPESEKKCDVILAKDSFICQTPILKGLFVPLLLIITFGVLGLIIKRLIDWTFE